jgi:hypothetical protein
LKAVQTVLKKIGELEVARDNMQAVAKTESIAHGWTKKQLTAFLMEAGIESARANDCATFVFPNLPAQRAELDKAAAINAAATKPKERIAKPIMDAIARSKEPLPLEVAIEQHKAKQAEKAKGNAPVQTVGGQSTATATAPAGQTVTTTVQHSAKKSPKEIEDEIGNLCAAFLSKAKSYDYDEKDCAAIFEEWAVKVFPPEVDADEPQK